jgi:hypothetical protein
MSLAAPVINGSFDDSSQESGVADDLMTH